MTPAAAAREAAPVAASAPDYLPAEWTAPARDLALDLVRGLAIVILVVNHIHLDSPLEWVTKAVLSAAEVLVLVSGVVAGMVFGRRWLLHGGRATTAMLLRRSRSLYVASVVVVALVGALTLVPGLATEALTVSPNVLPARDSYAYEHVLRLLWAVVSLEAGPWQFNILGFFIAAIATAPAVLWALDRGWWPLVVVVSFVLYALGRKWDVDVLPSQSERPFPLPVWQLLFVHGLVLGWHRRRIAAALREAPHLVGAIVAVAVACAAVVVLLGPVVLGGAAWTRWVAAHFDKVSLDPARVVTMVSLTAATYLLLTRCAPSVQRALAWLLVPFGRNSFYVFIMHVFVCLAVASVPALAGDGVGLIGNTLVQLACLALLWVMARKRFLFRWVPR